MNDVIIVIATHPDDETLGAGGSLFRFKKEGAEIHWLILTAAFTEQGYAPDLVAKRDLEIQKLAALYAFDGVHRLNYPTTRLTEIPRGEIISAISSIFQKVKPSKVILPFYGDVHSDHRVGFECGYACTKVFRYPSIKNIWMMETSSETDFGLPGAHNAFIPNVFVDISDFIDNKEQAFHVFDSEMGQHPFPRSIENLRALAINRGAAAGVKYAEAFMHVKSII
jgi:LmbE family N-acetylglucosaminyl deacetylase